jgi:hypothetical protein
VLDAYEPLGIDAVCLTKWDETVAPGEALAAVVEAGLPLSHLCIGQEVPADIVAPKPTSWRAPRSTSSPLEPPHDACADLDQPRRSRPPRTSRGLQIPRPHTTPVARRRRRQGRRRQDHARGQPRAAAGPRRPSRAAGRLRSGLRQRRGAPAAVRRHDLEDVANAGSLPRSTRCSTAPAASACCSAVRARPRSPATIRAPRRTRGAPSANWRSDFDIVVVDTGAGIGPATLAVAERSDLVLGITNADAASLTDAYALCKVLHLRGRALPQLVVNRVRSRDEAMRTAGKLSAVVKKFLATDLRLCGWVAQDAGVELGVIDQRPVALFGQGTGLEDLRGLCAAVLAGLPTLSRATSQTGAAQGNAGQATRQPVRLRQG